MASPLPRLPSLDLIRGFVAVGRRMSITLAAQDMNLTQSAVSRQVLALEAALGVRLLIRGHRAVAFTAEGERLFQTADPIVRQLQDLLGVLAAERLRRPVTLSASIGVTSLWLLPRLGRFQSAYPDIEVRVAASNRIVDLRNEGVDMAIRYCPATAVPDGAARLFGEVLVPVAHPSLGLDRLADADALSRHYLLEYDDPKRPWLQWREWLDGMGWSGARPRGMHRFNQYDQVIQAALSGQGIALGRHALIRPLLADGRLLALASPGADNVGDYAYWLIQAESEPRQAVRRVIEWLRAESADEEVEALMHESRECESGVNLV